VSDYRRILVATDFSPASAPAFDEALRLAKGSRAQLLVAHAYQEHDLPAIGFAATTAFDEWDRESRERALGQLELLLARARREGIDAHPLLLAGFPDEAIVESARQQGADLIVVGTHGRRGAARLFLGSVAARVVASAACPVMTVRGA
jgi:nucleotide-binding universal stress UspA family protein